MFKQLISICICIMVMFINRCKNSIDNPIPEIKGKLSIIEGIGSVVLQSNARFECSISSVLVDPDHPIFGRNFNNNINIEHGVLVGLYSPQDGYQSIGVSNE